MLFVTRAAWGARAPKSTSPISEVLGDALHYEGPAMGSFPHTSCASKVRGIQAFHMDGRGWADIAYSAVVCPHGYVYEGRGKGRRSAAQGTNDGNAHYYAVCGLWGQGDPVTDAAKQAYLDAFAWLGGGGQRRPHSSFHATACPGDPVRAWIAAGLPAPGPAPTPKPTPGAPAMDEFFAYDPKFFGGVTVAVSDIDGDGHLEVVTGAEEGGGPHVKVWRIVDGKHVELGGFMAYSSDMTGGVNVACAPGVIVTAPLNGGPHVRVFAFPDVLGG